MKKTTGMFIAFAILSSAQLGAQGASAQNLLLNGSFSEGADKRVPNWVFPQSPLKAHGADAMSIEYGVGSDASGNNWLAIGTTAPIKAHVWWQQEIVAQGGASYALSVRMAADVQAGEDGASTYQSPDVGVYFLDINGSWLGYLPLRKKVDFTSDWQTVTLKVTAPDNAAKIGVRLGVSSNAKLNVRFDDAVLIFAN